MQKGYVQVYTGNGKGKTTAALGLAVRAVGAGLKVFIGQFAKGMRYSELEALKRFEGQITVRQYGKACFIRNKPDKQDIALARKGLAEVAQIIEDSSFDVVILDEATVAVQYNLFSIKELLELLGKKPKGMELIITGRDAPRELIRVADLVTEMREIKHYFRRGVTARKGIEK